MYGKIGIYTGNIPWSKGLTKDTDERLKALGEKLSPIIKEQFKNGIRSNCGDRNPMWGHKPHMSTPESKERYSIAATNRIKKGQAGLGQGGGYITGYTLSSKMNEYMICRSSWEVLAVLFFDNDPTVQSFYYEPDTFKLEVGSRYTPDYLVYYTNGTSKYIEIKPDFNLLEGQKFARRLPSILTIMEEYDKAYQIYGNTWHEIAKSQYSEQFQLRLDELLSKEEYDEELEGLLAS